MSIFAKFDYFSDEMILKLWLKITNAILERKLNTNQLLRRLNKPGSTVYLVVDGEVRCDNATVIKLGPKNIDLRRQTGQLTRASPSLCIPKLTNEQIEKLDLLANKQPRIPFDAGIVRTQSSQEW